MRPIHHASRLIRTALVGARRALVAQIEADTIRVRIDTERLGWEADCLARGTGSGGEPSNPSQRG